MQKFGKIELFTSAWPHFLFTKLSYSYIHFVMTHGWWPHAQVAGHALDHWGSLHIQLFSVINNRQGFTEDCSAGPKLFWSDTPDFHTKCLRAANIRKLMLMLFGGNYDHF